MHTSKKNKISVTLILTCLLCLVTIFSALSQDYQKLQPHEVVDMANGIKMEVLRFRDVGGKEECEVIYYTDKRQAGTRKWEPTSKVLKLKQASQLLKDASNVATKNTRQKDVSDVSAIKNQPASASKTKELKKVNSKTTFSTNKSSGNNVSPFSKTSNTLTSNKTKTETTVAATHINEVPTDTYTLKSIEKKQIKSAAVTNKQLATSSKIYRVPVSSTSYAKTASNGVNATNTKPAIVKGSTAPINSNKNTAANKVNPVNSTVATAKTINQKPIGATAKPGASITSNNTKVAVKNTITPVQFTNQNISSTPVSTKSYNSKQLRDTASLVRVAVFAPIYIDDAFNGSTDNTITELPRNVLPGLEFYNGVMMAADSLGTEGARVEISIFDTKQTAHPLAEILSSPQLNNTGLIIAAITNPAELKQFSQFALNRNIPLISATYPNTVGVTGNPFFVLLNSSFGAHLEGLYKHMQKYYSGNTIVAVKQAGAKYDYIKNYITALNKNTRSVPLNIKWVDLKAGFTSFDLMKHLDSTKNNVVFVASPLESFGLDVVRTLSLNESYHCTAIGMPTWDGVKELNASDCKNVEIVYSTPFIFYSNNHELSNEVVANYRSKYFSRPSDMVYKGFEATYHFTKLLTKYRSNLINNLSDKQYTLFNQFDIEPVRLKPTNLKPDYLENKKLYFIKKQQGIVKSIL